MNIQTPRPFLIFTIFAFALLVCGNGISSRGVNTTVTVSNPKPGPENKTMNEKPAKTPPETRPVSGQAAASGVSMPVRDLPPATPQVERPPREINPQNTIPIKKVKTSVQTISIPAKRPLKTKPSRRSAATKKSGR